MKKRIIQIITAIQVIGCLVYGGNKILRAAGVGIGGGGDDGLWDNLSILCKISIIIWLITVVLITRLWAACHQGCKENLSPASCESDCARLWGGLLLIETVTLALLCGSQHID